MMRTLLKRNQTPIPRKRDKPRRKVNPYGVAPVKKEIVAVERFPDGREICNLRCKAGADEYQRRKKAMWERQGRRCALQVHPFCKEKQGRWPFDETQFDHEIGRTKGRQDDRIEVWKDGKLVWQNAAVCGWCNTEKGSKKLPYAIDAP